LFFMKPILLPTIFGLAILAQGCTTVPSPTGEFLSRTDKLTEAKGVRGKRLQTVAPSPPIATGTKLVIEPPTFMTTAEISPQITEPERALILNALARSACSSLSSQFEITDSATTPDAYRLRMGVSRVVATGKVGAAIGTVSGLVSPVGGVRPPFGLGALTVELELVAPNADQAAAMIWSRSADMVMAEAASSRIGDAYEFASNATSDFSQLVSNQSRTSGAISAIRNSFGRATDPACEVYGRQAGAIAGVVGLLGVPVPPEMTDKGRQPATSKP
jgi:Protein of unknown function (DUF3313)